LIEGRFPGYSRRPMSVDGASGMAAETAVAASAVHVANHSEVLIRFGWALAITVAGLGILIGYRRRLPRVFENRGTRIFFEVFLLGALQLVVAVLIGVVDLRAAWEGKIADGDSAFLWALPFSGAAAILLQAFGVLRSDASEIDLGVVKKDQAALNTQLLDARSQRDFLSIVMRAFLNVVSFKRERLKAAKTPDEGIKALQPTRQGMALIVACREVFDKMINRPGQPHYRVRVAYFRVTGDRLALVYCWNGDSPKCISLGGGSPVVAASFTFDAAKGCVARAVASTGETRWIPNAEAADKDPDDPFFFFDQSERETLKSMVAVPMRLEGEAPKYDVVSIDTDCEGYFNAADRRDEVTHVVANMAHRLLLEKEMERLSGGGGDA
jgi:hypothetical protein